MLGPCVYLQSPAHALHIYITLDNKVSLKKKKGKKAEWGAGAVCGMCVWQWNKLKIPQFSGMNFFKTNSPICLDHIFNGGLESWLF